VDRPAEHPGTVSPPDLKTWRYGATGSSQALATARRVIRPTVECAIGSCCKMQCKSSNRVNLVEQVIHCSLPVAPVACGRCVFESSVRDRNICCMGSPDLGTNRDSHTNQTTFGTCEMVFVSAAKAAKLFSQD